MCVRCWHHPPFQALAAEGLVEVEVEEVGRLRSEQKQSPPALRLWLLRRRYRLCCCRHSDPQRMMPWRALVARPSRLLLLHGHGEQFRFGLAGRVRFPRPRLAKGRARGKIHAVVAAFCVAMLR